MLSHRQLEKIEYIHIYKPKHTLDNLSKSLLGKIKKHISKTEYKDCKHALSYVTNMHG